MNITIVELPNYEVAYIRRFGSYFEPNTHWGRLMEWSFSKGLFPPAQDFIGISLDNPSLVTPENCRHDACITLPSNFKKEEHKEIKYQTLEGGLFALCSYYGEPQNLQIAYDQVYVQWLPASDFEPDFNRSNLEFSRNNPAEDSKSYAKVDLYIPIKEK